VAPGDEDRLAEAILNVLKDRAAAEAMGKQGQERARTLFSEEEYFQSYAGMIRIAERIGCR